MATLRRLGAMTTLRIGIIGAGGVAQVEHVPNLLRLRPLFTIVGIYDPSATARGFLSARYGLAAFDSLEALLSKPLDAVLIAAPDALHKEHALVALEHGLHVFCEKPLCYAAADIDDLIAARNTSGRILQVGYMKRFDPSYEAALERLPDNAGSLRHVSVEVTDPDAWPFVRHHDWRRAEDVPQTLIDDVAEKQRQQVARAVQVPLDELGFRGFCGAYCSSLVHDVNAVYGLLDRMGVPDGEIVGAQLYARGEGGHGVVRLLGGQALWTMTHLAVPRLPEYRERISLYFDEASLELEFPSPYLNHHPTRLTLKRGREHRLVCEDIRSGYEEPFIEELKGFWSAVVEGAAVRNTAEQARRDMRLLSGLASWHATHQPQGITRGAAS